MAILLVLENPKDWPLSIEGIETVSARQYLTEPQYSDRTPHKVFNLCRSYRYQTLGYYVSLLASARGHKPLPDVSTIQDLKMSELVKLAGRELHEEIQRHLADATPNEAGGEFTIPVYFGQTTDAKLARLALALFNQFPAPLLRATFARAGGQPNAVTKQDGAHWVLESVRTVATGDIPPGDFLFVLQAATHYFTKPHRRTRKEESRYDLAILHTKEEKPTPSNEKALKKFIKAGESMGMDVEIITRDDYGRLAEFDALFIRDTTAVNHYTFRFAKRAEAEGLIVIDHPDSIVRCSNKVFLHELLNRHRIATPTTLILHRDNWESAPSILGLPLVLKQPDSAFSLGVTKVKTEEDYKAQIDRLLKISDLLIAQAYTPTEYDWRVCVLDREPLFTCKYFMARGHWQIYNNALAGDDSSGDFETWPVSACPPDVLKTALRVANLIGDGLYGVDLKELDGKAHVMEINDNPNIDAGVEDEVLGDEVYARVMRVFLKRLEGRGRG